MCWAPCLFGRAHTFLRRLRTPRLLARRACFIVFVFARCLHCVRFSLRVRVFALSRCRVVALSLCRVVALLPCRVASGRVVSCRAVPCRVVTCRDVSCHLNSLLNSVLHPWTSGRIHRCHRCDPGLIPGLGLHDAPRGSGRRRNGGPVA